MTELLTKDQAAEMLTISVDTLEKLIAQGLIPVYRISPKVVRLDRADVLVYLESRRQRATDLARKQKVKTRPPVIRGGVNNSGYYPGMKVV